jgi:lysophospholipase L1-like esterase
MVRNLGIGQIKENFAKIVSFLCIVPIAFRPCMNIRYTLKSQKQMNKLLFILIILLLTGCKSQITIYTIGDSTMANKPNPQKNPERGWGQVLPSYFIPDVKIENKAMNGRSTRSFINENRWDSIYQKLKKGDYVFIQFGHNDSKDQDPKRFTNPSTAFRNNLIRFVNETREKGAWPILFTPIARRNFNDKGVLIDTHGNYPLIVHFVAREYKVPLIDLQYLTELMEEQHGSEGSKALHLHYKPGELDYYPEGKEDNTHLSEKGANQIARLVIEELKKQKNPLRKKLKQLEK